jgi:thymidylate kinase
VKGPFDYTRKAHSGMLVLSGLDGTGKSTQAQLLAERMRREGLNAVTVWSRWEPNVTAPFIKLAKRSLQTTERVFESDYSDFTDAKRRAMRSSWKRGLWQFMVWSEYAMQIRHRVRPALRRDTGVICDRYVYDTMIDIAINFSLSPDELETLFDHPLLALFPKPATVVFLDIDPLAGSTRKDDGTPAEYLADRRAYYLEMARFLGAPVIDAGRGIDEVFADLLTFIGEWRDSLSRRRSG